MIPISMQRNNDLEWEDYKETLEVMVSEDEKLVKVIMEALYRGDFRDLKSYLETLEERAINRVLDVD